MRIALLTETFSFHSGYLQNVLPKYLARQGAEVHVITGDLPPYYQDSSEVEALTSHADPRLVTGNVLRMEGFEVHVLAHDTVLGHTRLKGLSSKLREIKPHIVQTMVAIGWIPLEAALFKPVFHYALFTGNHTATSGYQPARMGFHSLGEAMMHRAQRWVPGRLISLATHKCYAVTSDCAEIAWRFFGVQPGKVETMHLGVDTEVFYPPAGEENLLDRERVRSELGISSDAILCIYTGKLTKKKNASILARAVHALRNRGYEYSAVFIGAGSQAPEIAGVPGCKVLAPMHFHDLAQYYRAADVGVWPTDESISTLDAAACALPLIISDSIVYRDHVAGNGLVFKSGDLSDLLRCLLELRDSTFRRELGRRGAQKMLCEWSWDTRAKSRLDAYRSALTPDNKKRPRSAPILECPHDEL
jgi:glycosyltransferase involved in cell wall biosynthesis